MKTIKNITATLILALVFTLAAFSQTPPPPNNNNPNNGGTTPVGGGAPVGGGLIILLASAGAYAYSKWNNKTPDYKVLK